METLNELKNTLMISSWPHFLSEKGPLAMYFKIISIIFFRRVANRCSLQAEIKPHTPGRAGKQRVVLRLWVIARDWSDETEETLKEALNW